MPHGYVFEVPFDGMGSPEPIRDMGRFSHEALAVDSESGNVYLTEDAGNSSGFYKFVPNVKGDLKSGGKLYMLRVGEAFGAKVANFNLGAGFPNGSEFWVDWVLIDTPDNPDRTSPGNFVWAQGSDKGAATFARLEGCWYSHEGRIYFVSTNDGAVGQGQI